MFVQHGVLWRQIGWELQHLFGGRECAKAMEHNVLTHGMGQSCGVSQRALDADDF